jgi:hypothetical protein
MILVVFIATELGDVGVRSLSMMRQVEVFALEAVTPLNSEGAHVDRLGVQLSGSTKLMPFWVTIRIVDDSIIMTSQASQTAASNGSNHASEVPISCTPQIK